MIPVEDSSYSNIEVARAYLSKCEEVNVVNIKVEYGAKKTANSLRGALFASYSDVPVSYYLLANQLSMFLLVQNSLYVKGGRSMKLQNRQTTFTRNSSMVNLPKLVGRAIS